MDITSLKDSEIIRIEALRLSVLVGAQNVVSPETKTEAIISRANKFEQYIVLGSEDGETS